MTTAHAATPYQIGTKIKRAVYAGDEIICMCDSMDELSYEQEVANAEFIVRACNAHGDLVWAAQEADIAIATIILTAASSHIKLELMKRRDLVRATLAKAGAA